MEKSYIERAEEIRKKYSYRVYKIGIPLGDLEILIGAGGKVLRLNEDVSDGFSHAVVYRGISYSGNSAKPFEPRIFQRFVKDER